MPLFRILLLFLLLIPSLALPDEMPVLARTGKTFDPSIPTLQSVLGHDFGERITSHAGMEKYLNALSESSAKIRVQKIGQTYEGRALYYVLVSSAENIARLEDLRQANLQLSDPRTLGSSQADAIIDTHPIFVSLTYSVHGNEHSGVESGLALIYYLLASNDVETQELLKNTVVLIDPMQNPDGRERFIQYFYSVSGNAPNADLNAAEHNEVWPGGRTNHYLFDMNRDWAVMTQQETQARIRAYRMYQPQVYSDLHEMGENATYFFPPPAEPHNPNVPGSVLKWWNILGQALAAEFDRNQIEYFTQERFDFWYPGYGDSWPTYNGALAGTFEQGSVRGLVKKRRDGVVVHYKDAIWNHFLASLTTCRLASERRREKLRDFYDFRASAVQEGKTGPVRQYLIRRSFDPLQSDRVARLLLSHGIEVRKAQSAFRVSAHGYMEDRAELRNFQAGDYIIPMDQPLKRLIQVLFEQESRLNPEFLRQEEERRKEDEPTELYDITAWSLPLAAGLDAYWSGDAAAPSTLLTDLPMPRVPLVPSTYAYILSYSSNQSVAAAAALLQRKVLVRFATRSFTLDQKAYPAGSFIILLKDNPKDLAQILGEISEATGVEFVAASTGWTEQGPDLGSNDVLPLLEPKVAVLTNSPTNPTAYGAVFYLLDQRYRIPFTAMNTIFLPDTEIRNYNVLVLPDGGDFDKSYKQFLDPELLAKIKAWVETGGTLIASGNAAGFLIESGVMTGVQRIRKFKKDSAEPAPEKEGDKERPEQDFETEVPDVIPGSIARARLYLKSFLAFGYTHPEIPVFINSSNVFVAPEDLRPAVSYVEADRLKVAGLFWDIWRQRLEKRAYATVEKLGEGHVVLFAEESTFRASWESLDRLFLNGVLFGPSM